MVCINRYITNLQLDQLIAMLLLLTSLLAILIQRVFAGSYDSTRLWQSVGLVGISEINEWYGVITGANDENTIEDLFESLPNDHAKLLQLTYDLHPGYTEFAGEDDTGSLNWFELNNKKYVKPDDSFYLKSDELKAQSQISDNLVLQDGELVVGTNPTAPLVVFYGSAETGDFEDFNRNLYTEAIGGKIRLLWRPTGPAKPLSDLEVPNEYAYEYSINAESWGKEVQGDFDLPAEYSSEEYIVGDIKEGTESELAVVVASLISDYYEKTNDFHKTFEYARKIINNYPILMDKLTASPESLNKTSSYVEKISNLGITYDAIGVYLNYQHWKLSDLNPWNFIAAVTYELKMFKSLFSTLKGAFPDLEKEDVKSILQKYSEVGVMNLQHLQPARYDFHRIPGFSESVIYFCDIENDEIYANLSSDTNAFFQKSKFGELPEYKENWNEFIFVIDFDNLATKDTSEIFAGFKRALEVLELGYPQRIGLLPLFRGEPSEVVKHIYALKDEGLDSLKEFLQKFDPTQKIPEIEGNQLPPVSEILHNFGIKQNSVIVNGQIHPFTKNTWHYKVANIVKNDVNFVTSALKRVKDTKAREILHFHSLTARHPEYVTDYFEDNLYTIINGSVLDQIESRVLYLNKPSDALLHTITVVDDFNTGSAIEKIINLLSIKFTGVRVRLVHRGEELENWENLNKMIVAMTSNSMLIESLRTTMNKPPVPKTFDSETYRVLRQWLPSLSKEFIEADSYALLNGRYINLSNCGPLSVDIWEAIIQRESRRTLDFVAILQDVIPDLSERGVLPALVEESVSCLSKMFYGGSGIFDNGIEYTGEAKLPRLDILKLLDKGSLNNAISSGNEDALVDVTVIIDPVEERSQKFLHLVNFVKDLSFVNVNLLTIPTLNLSIIPNHRIYSDVKLDINDDNYYTFSRDLPSNVVGEASKNDYKPTAVVVEGHVFKEDTIISKSNVEGEIGVCLEIVNSRGNVISKGISMGAFGYVQFQLPSLEKNLSIRSCDSKYDVVSFSSNARSDYLPMDTFHVQDLSPKSIVIKVKPAPNNKALVRGPVKDNAIHVYVTIHDSFEASIFTQQLMAIVTALSPTTEVHFWISSYAEPPLALRNLMRYTTSRTNNRVVFSMVSYHWPKWLRPQRFLERRLDVMRILFLDVMFPEVEIEKLILFTIRTKEIPDIEALHKINSSACFIMKKHRGEGYWKHGYWKKFLKGNNLRFYDASSTFVVNMEAYRNKMAGEALRIHYQRLSADVKSLEDIDQDLLNSLQQQIKIKSLLSKETVPLLSTKEMGSWYSELLKFITPASEEIDNNENVDPDKEEDYLHDEL
ncbi:HEL226Wp [Eremothecium sinecaudum]|uniref:HEL226Wp n=1 Tax=Eremothecium sinecaudum TaxID=45286 RepID=A0A0X8HT87_9SACH|nr:HEL226Wp [Eremothecium sinecaudum]AMD21055.1 HEL226Wp [Eremothecium sinecaudum]